MANDGAKWHWSEGMKYAIEGIRLVFMLNGAAAVSILTFIGKAEIKSSSLIFAMVAFP